MLKHIDNTNDLGQAKSYYLDPCKISLIEFSKYPNHVSARVHLSLLESPSYKPTPLFLDFSCMGEATAFIDANLVDPSC